MSSKVDINKIARRYATAAFSWAEDVKKLSKLESDLAILKQLLDIKEFVVVLNTPLISRAGHIDIMEKISKLAKFSEIMTKLSGIMAENRRLYCLAATVAELETMLSKHKGEITVEVITAIDLTEAELKKIATLLKKQLGHKVDLNVSKDENLIGGLIVKAGSLMVDSSVRTQLEKMKRTLKKSDVMVEQETMKEVA